MSVCLSEDFAIKQCLVPGVRVAKVAEAMGMTVIGLNSRSSQEDLFQMLQQADVISLHCPLTPDTYHLLG